MKITVAILDKDAAFRGILLEKLGRLAGRFGFEFCISGYSKPTELEENQMPFDLLIMNTSFDEPETDGIAWVKRQEPSGRYLNLMYVSELEDRVFDAMETMPIAFIRKSHLETDLQKALQRYKDKLDYMTEFVIVPEGRKRHVFLPSDIVLFCSKGHYIDIFLQDGSKKMVRGKMDDIEKYVGHCGFLRIHTSYLVNIRHVDHVDRKKVCLSNKQIIFPSLKYRNATYEKLKIYQFEEMDEE